MRARLKSVSPPPGLRAALAGAAHAAGLRRLFASNGYGCYCRYWHFAGTDREWLARCAERPEENEAEMGAALCSGSESMRGVVATVPLVGVPEQASAGSRTPGAAGTTSELDVIGWLKLAPALTLDKLYGKRLYRGLPCFTGERTGVFTVACLLVREDQRRRGVARALLAAALEIAPSLGAHTLEALPRGDADAGGAALMMGPSKLFLAAGFEMVRDFAPYPVLRKPLQAPAP